jgi:nucleoside-diphosphate-sugar epimerase
MRTVVTGGAGFIGSHLIEALLAHGDDVVCVERCGASRGWLAEAAIEWSPVGLDDPDVLKKTLVGTDVVFHLAALTQACTAGEYYSVNTEGTARVFEAAAALETPPRVILVSSLAALGPCRNGELLSRHTVPYPLSHYGLSKLLAESIAHGYFDRVPTTVVRLASVYGPRERAVLKMFQLVRRGLAITVGGWRRQVSLIYVKDVVGTLISTAAAARTIGHTYCLAHPEPVRWVDFALEVGRVVGRRPILVSVPTALAWAIARLLELFATIRHTPAILNRERVREISQERWVCNSAEVFADTRYRPRYPISRGVRETAEWYQRVGWL